MARTFGARPGRAVLTVAVMMVTVASPGPVQTAQASPSGALACTGSWQTVPGGSSGFAQLSGVTALSASDVWADGIRSGNNGTRTLIEHFDGVSWKVVASENVGGLANVLTSTTAVDPSDVWAVGYRNSSSGGSRTLIEHYDGVSWSVVPSPNGRGDSSYLYSVSSSASNDVWATGSWTQSESTFPLAEHWDGTSWTRARVSGSGGFSGVASLPSVGSLAAGFRASSGSPLSERWNGTRWKTLSTAPAGDYSTFNGIGASSSTDAWAVGSSSTAGLSSTLAEWWDGSSWVTFPSPNPGPNGNSLGAVLGSFAGAWAVGYDYSSSFLPGTLIQRWNPGDGTWKVVPSPDPGSGGSSLDAISGSISDAWAVGSYLGNNGYRGLIEHYCP